MRIIYCDSVFDPTIVEPDYLREKVAAIKSGLNHSLISFEALVGGNFNSALKLVKPTKNKETGIYRGWMLTPNQYKSLYDGLLTKNIRLMNTPTEYQHCHYLPDSYHVIRKQTPKSIWTENLEEASILELAKTFDNKAIIVKDYVKSEKHYWKEACFIPDASDTKHVLSVVNRFLELRGSSLNKGIVFREFKALEYLTEHSKSHMPLTKEYRLFFANKKLVSVFNYWDEGIYGESQPELDQFVQLAQKIQSNFFTMDIAQTKQGNWIVMELGDGQVAGLPDNANENEFYFRLKTLLQ